MLSKVEAMLLQVEAMLLKATAMLLHLNTPLLHLRAETSTLLPFVALSCQNLPALFYVLPVFLTVFIQFPHQQLKPGAFVLKDIWHCSIIVVAGPGNSLRHHTNNGISTKLSAPPKATVLPSQNLRWLPCTVGAEKNGGPPTDL